MMQIPLTIFDEFKRSNDIYNHLKKSTGKNKYEKIMDSSELEITYNTILEHVIPRNSIMILIRVNDIIFGSYSSGSFQETDNYWIMKEDPKHFVFLYNTTTRKYEKFSKIDSNDRNLIVQKPVKPGTKSGTFNPSLVTCYGAFTIENEFHSRRSQIDYSFEGNYDVKKGITADVFLKKKYFLYDNLLILHWS